MNEIHAPYLIVGFSVAGRWGARAIQEKNAFTPIVAVSEEQGWYSRPLITYALGGNNPSIEHSTWSLDATSLNILEGDRVEHFDSENRVAFLRSGKRVFFEKALLAPGGVPIVPPLEGIAESGVFTFTGRRDLERMRQFLETVKPRRILILGGGFIGLKTCEAFMRRGLEITLVELSSRLLPLMLDDDGSRYVENALVQAGVQVILGETVTAFEGNGEKLVRATLREGGYTPVDCAVVAVGVRPNVEWLRDSGIEIQKGILVDEFQETSKRSIFAAGDVAETRHLLTGERGVVAIWPEAVRQGKVAGANMAGGRVTYPGSLPLNALDLGGMALVSVGLVNPPGNGDYEALVRKEKNEYMKVILKDERIVGLVMLGKIEKSGLYIRLLRERIPVTSFRERLLDPKFSLVSLPREFRKSWIEGVGLEV
ncbi:MAG: FAD/NAD(P)-binding oxidoreductase [Atribacterota bacterium]